MYRLLTEDKDIKTDVLIPIDCTLQGYFDVLKEATAAGWKLYKSSFDFTGMDNLYKALYGTDLQRNAFIRDYKNDKEALGQLKPILVDALGYLEGNSPANQKVSLVLAIQVAPYNSETANYISPLSDFDDTFKQAIACIQDCAHSKELMMMVIAEALGKTSISYTEEQAIYKFITDNSDIHT
jgi:hypothetical protein